MLPIREGRQQPSGDSERSSGLWAADEGPVASPVSSDPRGSEAGFTMEDQLAMISNAGSSWKTCTLPHDRRRNLRKSFEQAGTTTVLKLSNTEDASGLWNDYKMHARVAEAFSNTTSLKDLYIPQIYYFTTASNEKWWDDQKANFPPHYGIEPRSVLCTERILPLPGKMREVLIAAFCPDAIQSAARTDPGNKDCLARVYLGKRETERVKPLSVFSLRNFNLNLDRIEGMGIQDTGKMARLMGSALAVMHWKAGIDADDVEFVLGSSPTYRIIPQSLSPREITSLPDTPENTWIPESQCTANFKKRITHLWLLDFNRCKDMARDASGVQQAVRSFYRNDPYYPRPGSTNTTDSKLWDKFVEGYMNASKDVLEGEDDDGIRELPQRFIDECVAEQERRFAAKEAAEQRLAETE